MAGFGSRRREEADFQSILTSLFRINRPPHVGGYDTRAFTLLELLVVITIIGILAAIGLPAIRGMTKSNSLAAADRQMLDDIGYARRLAIANHTTVYMLFIPPAITQWTPPTDPNLAKMMNGLYQGQFTTYALFSYRSVGDQPGQRTPHYWTPWRTLPNGVYIATNKFYTTPNYAPTFHYNMQFPFPVATNFATVKGDYYLPYLAFNYLGQSVYTTNGVDVPVIAGGNSQAYEYIPLARGSIFYPRDANGNLIQQSPDIVETPQGNAYYTNFANINYVQNGLSLPSPEDSKVYNQIYIDPLTGKARVERQEVQ